MISCQQSDPVDYYRDGDKLRFSDYNWTIKIHEDEQWGPGPNYFSGHKDDVFLDENGYLHLRISNRNDKWYSTEVVNDFAGGYGTYIFTIEGDLFNIPENIVFGLFSWDDNTFQTDAYSEIDIEFSKWLDSTETNTLLYSVQPLNWPPHPERTIAPEISPEDVIGVSTHAFIWTDSLISWISYSGDTYGQGDIIASWSFNQNNPPRYKYENGNTSNGVIIPNPGPNTNARINFWILPEETTAPSDSMEHEIIIRSFEYLPL